MSDAVLAHIVGFGDPAESISKTIDIGDGEVGGLQCWARSSLGASSWEQSQKERSVGSVRSSRVKEAARVEEASSGTRADTSSSGSGLSMSAGTLVDSIDIHKQ
jgi:hypothetical protein